MMIFFRLIFICKKTHSDVSGLGHPQAKANVAGSKLVCHYRGRIAVDTIFINPRLCNTKRNLITALWAFIRRCALRSMWICLSAITRRQCEATRFAIIALSFMFLRQLERYLSQSATWKSSKSVKWQEINREISSKCVLNCAVGDALAGDSLAMASNYVSVVFISVCVVVAVALPQNAFLRDGTIFSCRSLGE